MTKFQKIQKLSSLIPGISNVFVAIVTTIQLKRYKVSAKLWFFFYLAFFLPGIAGGLISEYIMSGQFPILNFIVVGLIGALGNIFMVDLQIAAAKAQTASEPAKEKKPFNVTAVVLCSIAGAVIVSIGISVSIIVYSILHPSINIEDTNGNENTNLAVITVDEIITGTNRHSSFSSSWSHQGEQTGVTGNLADYDYDRVTFRCKRISGVKTLQATKATSDQLVLEINSEVIAGNLGIVIEVDGKYYESVAVNDVCTVTLSDVAGKIVAVKIGSESAEMYISVSRVVTVDDSPA